MRLNSWARCAFAAGIALRVWWVLAGPHVLLWDDATYRELASSIATGHGYQTGEGPTAFWVPGWPAWLSLFVRAGLGDTAMRLGNVGLAAVTIALVDRLARDLYGAKAAAAAAAWVALLPSLVALPGLLASENLAIPLAVATVLLLRHAGRKDVASSWALAGASCGLAILVREANLALAATGLLLALGRPRSRWPARFAAFALVAALLVVPWIARNRQVMGLTKLTTSAMTNVCAGLGEGADGGGRYVPWAGQERVADARAYDCVKQGLGHRPFALVTLAPAKLTRWLAYDDWEFDVYYSHALRERAWRALGAFCDLVYWAMLAWVVVAVAKRRADATLLLHIASFFLATLLTFGNARFHAVVLPLFAVLASSKLIERTTDG